MNDLHDFLRKHHACNDGLAWLRERPEITTLRKLWLRDDLPPHYRVWLATRPGVLSEAASLRFGCWCARRVQHLMAYPRGIAALDAVDAYLRGEITREQLDAAASATAGAAALAAQAQYLRDQHPNLFRGTP